MLISSLRRPLPFTKYEYMTRETHNNIPYMRLAVCQNLSLQSPHGHGMQLSVHNATGFVCLAEKTHISDGCHDDEARDMAHSDTGKQDKNKNTQALQSTCKHFHVAKRLQNNKIHQTNCTFEKENARKEEAKVGTILPELPSCPTISRYTLP